jgi:hypothetical protein
VFFDFAHAPVNWDSRLFVDPNHPSEYLVLWSWLEMMKDPRVQQALPEIDVRSLQRTLEEHARSGTFFDVF